MKVLPRPLLPPVRGQIRNPKMKSPGPGWISHDIHTDGVDNDRLSDSREFLNVKNVVLIGADGDIVVKYLCLDVVEEWMENVRETNLKFHI